MAETAATKQPNRGIMAKVRERFARSPGVVMYVSELAEEFGVAERVIQVTMANIRREYPDDGVEIHIAARAWVSLKGGHKKDPVKETKRMFEELAVTKSGEILIQDEAGAVYRATEL